MDDSGVGDTVSQKPGLALGSLPVGMHEGRAEAGKARWFLPCCDWKSEVEGVRKQDAAGVTSVVVPPIALHPQVPPATSNSQARLL